MHLCQWFVAGAIVSGLVVGCGDDTEDAGGGGQAEGGQGQGGQLEGGSAEGGQDQGGHSAGGNAEGGQGEGGGAPSLQSVCEDWCAVSASLIAQLGCDADPAAATCVEDCTGANTEPTCNDDYYDFAVCLGTTTAGDCSCNDNGGIDCFACTTQEEVFFECLSP